MIAARIDVLGIALIAGGLAPLLAGRQPTLDRILHENAKTERRAGGITAVGFGIMTAPK